MLAIEKNDTYRPEMKACEAMSVPDALGWHSPPKRTMPCTRAMWSVLTTPKHIP